MLHIIKLWEILSMLHVLLNVFVLVSFFLNKLFWQYEATELNNENSGLKFNFFFTFILYRLYVCLFPCLFFSVYSFSIS